jgi:Tol biopolymer transport system component
MNIHQNTRRDTNSDPAIDRTTDRNSLTFLLLIAFAWALTFFARLAPANAILNPWIDWKEIETQHFRIIFDSRHYELAKLYAMQAEQAFVLVSPSFGVWPEKTALILDDSTDLSNGSAGGIPYPMISAYPVLPSTLDTIGDYGNWGLELITHEYTHILTFEPTNGILKPLRWVFGTIIRPNAYLPRWYLEGLAVEMESRQSRFGRLRSSNFLSVTRALVEAGTLKNEDISRINDLSIPDAIGGNRAYLFGSLLWEEMVRVGGPDIIGKLNYDYSRRIPFFINTPVVNRLGATYAQLLQDCYDRLEKQANRQLELIKASGEVTGEKVTWQKGFGSQSPTISPDGLKMIYIGQEHDVSSYVDIIQRENKSEPFTKLKPHRLLTGKSITHLSWLPDSSGFIYDDIGKYLRYTSYSDIWRFDLKPGRPLDDPDGDSDHITRGWRARAPSLSPDGRFIVFMQNMPGSTRLAFALADGSRAAVLYTPPFTTRISRPEFLGPDKIIFGEKRADGMDRLKVLDLIVTDTLTPKGEPREVLHQFGPIRYQHVTSQGVLFAAQETGVSNIFLADLNLETARPITNTTTRAMTSELDPVTGDLYYSRYAADGAVLYEVPKAVWEKTPAHLPDAGKLVEVNYPKYEDPKVEVNTEEKDYSPWSYLLPRTWLPYVWYVPNGTYFEASTGASDPTGRHSYNLGVAYDTVTNQPGFFAEYASATNTFPLTLDADLINEYIYTGDFIRRTGAAEATYGFYVPYLDNSWRAGLSWLYEQTTLSGFTTTREGPRVGLWYNGSTQRGLEISPEKGASAGLMYTKFLKGLGNTDYEQTDFSGTLYFSKWLPEHHVIVLSTNGSIAPRLANSFLGQSTVGGAYVTNLVQSPLIMRGYNNGVFLGRDLVTGTFEYRFPLWYTYQGFGTKPFFLQRLHGDIFLDAITLDGYSYDFAESSYITQKLGHFFYGTGVELKADVTILYGVNAQIIGGLYYGTDSIANPNGVFPFIGLGL